MQCYSTSICFSLHLTALGIAPFITTLACCSKTRMPIFNFMFQMALRRLVVQTRRLLHGRKWSNSLSTGLLDYCITAQFLHRPLPRGNAYAVALLSYFRMICLFYMDCHHKRYRTVTLHQYKSARPSVSSVLSKSATLLSALEFNVLHFKLFITSVTFTPYINGIFCFSSNKAFV